MKKLFKDFVLHSTDLYLMICWPLISIAILATFGFKGLLQMSPYLVLGLFFGVINTLKNNENDRKEDKTDSQRENDAHQA